MPKQAGYQKATVTFFGTDLVALQQLDPNETYVNVAAVCRRLHINVAAQERRIRAHAVLGAGARKLSFEHENGEEQALGLRSDLLPLWLAAIDGTSVAPDMRPQLDIFQRECASLLWQSFKPQGFSTEDELLPNRHEQAPVDQAYVAAAAMATLARHQLLIERQIAGDRLVRDDQRAALDASQNVQDDPSAVVLAQTVRRVAHAMAERSRRNEYGGVYTGLYRQFGITSYRRMPPGRLREALEWLERWHGDLLGEPEPPPDI